MDKRRFWPDYCGFLSLVISVAMIVLWICGVWELKVVNLNTFIGVIVSLLAIIVTLVIAWQIYNALELKNKVEELKQLEDKIKEQEKSLEQFRIKTENNIYKLVGWEFLKDNHFLKAFNYYLAAIEVSIQMDNSKDIKVLLDTLALISEVSIDVIDMDVIEEIKQRNDSIKSLSNYHFIKDRYEPIYNEFMSRVEKAEE